MGFWSPVVEEINIREIIWLGQTRTHLKLNYVCFFFLKEQITFCIKLKACKHVEIGQMVISKTNSILI